MQAKACPQAEAAWQLRGGSGTGGTPAWDRFVLGHHHGSPFHLIAWKESIKQTFGYKPFYLATKRGEQICGVLPLFLTGGFITGKRLISSPFAVYGGILADSDQARSLLLERAEEISADLQVRDLELRQCQGTAVRRPARISRYVTFTRQIGPSPARFQNKP